MSASDNTDFASKPVHLAATVDRIRSPSNGRSATPESPRRNAAVYAATPTPIGETAPMPVMTARPGPAEGGRGGGWSGGTVSPGDFCRGYRRPVACFRPPTRRRAMVRAGVAGHGPVSGRILDAMGKAALRILLAVALLGVECVLAQPSEAVLGGDGRWEQVRAPEAETDEALVAEARRLLAEGRPREAEQILTRWIRDNTRSGSPWLPTAYRLRGDAKLSRGREYRALFDYERVARDFPASEEFVKAVERQVDIGILYLNGLRRHLFGLRIAGAETVGEEALIRAAQRLPGSHVAERALFELAEYYYRKAELRQAATTYGIILEVFPDSRHRRRAMEQRVYANIAQFKGPRYDGSGLVEAAALIREYSRRWPADAQRAGLDSALLARLDESAAAQMLETARWYLRRGDPVSARFTLRRLVRKHPDTVSASRALDLMDRHGWTPPREPADPPGPVDPPEEPAGGEGDDDG
jgi:tetratricopeptide (TPR) repeat protein